MSPQIRRYAREAFALTMGPRTWYFSYDRCEAFRHQSCRIPQNDPGALRMPVEARRDRVPSPTTREHLTRMGVLDWPTVPDEAFDRLIGDA